MRRKFLAITDDGLVAGNGIPGEFSYGAGFRQSRLGLMIGPLLLKPQATFKPLM
jgi:hypothetical protein